MGKTTIYMYNIRGLRQDIKRREVFHFLHLKRVDITFLQETHFTKEGMKRYSAE